MRTKQHTLWLLAALSAPLAHFSGSGWLMTALAASAVLPLILLPKAWDGMPKPLALLQLLWLGAVAGALLGSSSAYWPSDNDLAVPLTLLALAALTNAAAAPRIGAVLALCIALLSIPAAVSGTAKAEPEWLLPAIGEWPWSLTLVLLLPTLPAAGEGRGRGAVYGLLLAAALSLLVQGTISPQVAASVPDPFYQTARTLGHLEPIIAAGVTLGWYAMASYLLENARWIGKQADIGKRLSSVLSLGTAIACALCRVQLQSPFWALLSTFLWVLAPFLTKIKKVEKT